MLKNKVGHGFAGVGDEIVCVVKQSRPIASASLAVGTTQKVKKGDVRRAVVVRTRRATMRPDGRFIKFDDNAVVLLNNKKEMLGTRITGIVSADLRRKGWSKITSLAPRVSVKTFYQSFAA